MLLPEARGRGIATEVLSLGLDYALLTRGLHRVTIGTRDDNLAMQRVADKLGFRLEARFREKSWFEGRFCDALGYAILDREWAARKEHDGKTPTQLDEAPRSGVAEPAPAS